MIWRLVVVSIAAVGVVSCGTDSANRLHPGDVWIQDVTLVSPERPGPVPHAHVVIREARIFSVSTESPASAGPGITVIPGAGKYPCPDSSTATCTWRQYPACCPDQEAAMPEVVASGDWKSKMAQRHLRVDQIEEETVRRARCLARRGVDGRGGRCVPGSFIRPQLSLHLLKSLTGIRTVNDVRLFS